MQIKHKLFLDYEFLDCGFGYKLERFGNKLINRPESVMQCKPKMALSRWTSNSKCFKVKKNNYIWTLKLRPWIINYGPFKFILRCSQSKNIGLFPEQHSNWLWLFENIKPGARVLNLFAYTGVYSLVCSYLKAHVTHLDTSKSAISWAVMNANLNKLTNIKWIRDDAENFIKRIINRNEKYDVVIMDPPPFGKSDCRSFNFFYDINRLLKLVKQIFAGKNALFLMSTYANNLSQFELLCIVRQHFPDRNIKSGVLQLGKYPISTFVRF